MEQQNNESMTLGSLFDGSGGFPLGGVIAGITPKWAAEIEPFPIRVTSVRFPAMTHLGDISKIKGSEIEPVNIITFGSPCQDMSVAEPTDDDISKWREIFSIHAKAMGKTTKPKSDNQIRKWLQNPQSDSAEYKMWGNGVALPNVYFVLSGIMHYAQESAT